MGKLFGTDGVRGVANESLTCDLAFKIGQAAAFVLAANTISKPARIMIGRDTRLSGEMLESALVAGICSTGAHAVTAGVLTTPCVAFLTKHYRMDAGIVISASHNSVEFNGIKIFDTNGFKLSDAAEEKIEKIILEGHDIRLPIGEEVGRRVNMKNAYKEYIDYLTSTTDVRFNKLKVALDCANGAASDIAPELFVRLGTTIYPIHNNPDGTNINKNCGSTDITRLQAIVTELGVDIGIAFDGDADRLIAVDEHGAEVNGDKIMAICALFNKQEDALAKNTLVTTKMSNYGLFKYLESHDIASVKTDVGDRYVLECMDKNGFSLGGEQSGHIIFRDFATTGDGLLSAVQLISIMLKTGTRLSKLANEIEIYPQVLLNVPLTKEQMQAYDESTDIKNNIELLEKKYSGNGRVLIRKSGTEPLLRIMIEGQDTTLIKQDAMELEGFIKANLPGFTV